jgi:ribonuclease Z
LDKAIRNKHMIFREAAELAKAGQVKELLLTHFSPVMQVPELYRDNAESIFPYVVIGQDRLIKRLSFRDE